MTSAIDQFSRIASMVRAAVAAQKDETKRHASASKGRPAAAQTHPSDLRSLIANRVSSIAADDPQRERKVFRAFLEATLLAELGQHVASDPLFASMVDAVQEQMMGDEKVAAAVKQAVQLLLSPPS